MQWRTSMLVGGGACLVVGCSLITPLDDLRGDAAPSDASANDAVSNNDSPTSTDGGADSGGNLVSNSSFDNGNGGCGSNWGNGYGETFSRESPGHTGQYACDVCIQSSGSSYQIDAVNPIPVQAGSYYAEAWLATDDGGVATQAGIQVYFTGDGGISNCNGDGTSYCQGNIVTPGAWTVSSTTFDVTGSGEVNIDLHSYAGPANSCFAADDVALYAQ